MFRTKADIEKAIAGVIISSERDYSIFTAWVNGTSQVDLARRWKLSPNRVSQIIMRHKQYYDGSVGHSFYEFVRRVTHTRPTLYALPISGDDHRCLLCSVVVVNQKFLGGSWLGTEPGRAFGAGDITGPLRKMPVATMATLYLQSILEQ